MKWLPVLLFAAILHIHPGARAQKISLHLVDAPLKQAFDEIQRQSGASFLYTEKALKMSKPVNVNVDQVSLDDALTACFEGQPLAYRIVNHTVTVMENRNFRFSPALRKIPEVAGAVSNDHAEPLSGVSVRLKRSNKGALTDEEGVFRIVDVPENAILEFTAIGYERAERKINGAERLNIQLIPAIDELDQALVIGYGNTTRRTSTGAISKVSQQDIAAQPVFNPLAAMTGRMSGVYIRQMTGVPGGNFSIRIRGKSSIREEGNFPLYIIDGSPFTSTTLSSVFASGSITQTGNPLNMLNPADIESIEVLKDADATAIYGSRGSNGVVLIATRKAKGEKTVLGINYFNGGGKLTRTLPLLKTEQYIEMRREAFANDGLSPGAADNDVNGVWPVDKYTDWQKVLTGNTAVMTSLQTSLEGGGERTHFLLRAGHDRETTVFPGSSGNQRLTALFHFAHLGRDKKLRISWKSLIGNDQLKLPQFDLLHFAHTLAPNAPSVYTEEGKLNWENDGWDNPFAELYKEYRSHTNNLINNLVVSYSPASALEYKTSIGYSIMHLTESAINPAISYRPLHQVASGFSVFNEGRLYSFIAEPQLSYRRTLAGGTFEALLGSTFERSMRQTTALLGTGYADDAGLRDKQAATDLNLLNFEKIDYRYAGVFARLRYNARGRYLVHLTGRRDGSSRFAPGKQFGNFGAIGAAWIFSETRTSKRLIPFLSFGKIRASFGSSGNDQIGDYQYLNTFLLSPYSYEGVQGAMPSRLANPGFQWEMNKKWEIAMETGLWNNRIFLSVAHFRNRSTHQLIGYFLPPTTGFNSVQDNFPATVQNAGIEIESSASLIKTNRFQWSANLNFTVPRNKLLAFPDIDGSSYAHIYEVGASLYSPKAFRYTGVDPATGVYRFMDKDGNGSLDFPGDLSVNAEISQRWFGGWETNIRRGNLSLDLFIQFVKQKGVSYHSGFEAPGTFSNQPALVMSRWQMPGDRSAVQRFTTNYHTGASEAYSLGIAGSDLPATDASFVRIKNISLSFLAPDPWIRKAGLSLCRLYVQCQNLFTITKYIGDDPENNGSNRLPPLKTIVAGIQINL
ncbi:MAG TPA: SusC/RagA family TonB-linked outer membrane protein [Flavitalea sp.]|nr:SusC/RagA family TonB-linked outer membrane protein [Flavitalea sp.]